MPVIPFPSERVFNSATFTCRYIVLSTARNVSNLHLKFSFFFKFPISFKNYTMCMPVIPFPSERVFNSATFMCRHIVLATVRNFLNLHLKKLRRIFFLSKHTSSQIMCQCLYFICNKESMTCLTKCSTSMSQ